MSSSPDKVRPLTIAILALGGEGGGVLADWIVDMALNGDHIAQATSVPGVAQRTGATIYYVELFRKPAARAAGRDPVLALMPVPGDVDVVLACELMEAARAVERDFVTPDRTTLIASTHRVFAMTEKMALADGRADHAALVGACQAAAKATVMFDMAAIADATRSVVSAVLFGALAGSGALPFQRGAFEAAIRRGGVGVAGSLAAFAAGCEAAREGKPIVAPPADQRSADALINAGVERLTDYQDRAYAQAYLARISRIREIEQRHGDGSERLLAETARQLALAMAYEDIIRVAELKIRSSRFRRVGEQVQLEENQILEIADFFHPRRQEIADMLPAALGRWLLRTRWAGALVDRFARQGRVIKTTSVSGFGLLYLLAMLKPLRRRSLRFACEQDGLDRWLDLVVAIAQTDYPLAVEVARARSLVKGYGETHARGEAKFARLTALVPELRNEGDPAGSLRACLAAALADEAGQALDKAIAGLRDAHAVSASPIAIEAPAAPGARHRGANCR
jgi:indolepyruvate ferredoxin oxidoreductase, beta subunit